MHRLALLTAVLAATACGGSTAVEPRTQPVVIDALPRALSASEQKLVNAANDFSFSLFRQLSAAQKDSNVFTSPLSASMALGMTMNGAAGPTLSQMQSTLGFANASEAEINDGYKSLISLLRGLDASVDFRIANSIWYRNGFPVNQTFVDASRNFFDAQVTALDFNSASAVSTINSWVNTSTAAKIPKIIDVIEQDQVMFLINAIYFKGSWREQFDPKNTTDTQFHGVAGDQPMKLMHRNGKARMLYATDYDAVDLAYGNSAYTMTVVLPHQGKDISAVAASLTASSWATLAAQLHETTADLYLPRFKLEWERTLNADLKSLGMRDAFIPDGADFTRMSPLGKMLYISVVKQKTYVDVNEEGTEAAAVTNVGIRVTSAPPSFRVDRPFIFVIRERLSGTIVFMGKIMKMP